MNLKKPVRGMTRLPGQICDPRLQSFLMAQRSDIPDFRAAADKKNAALGDAGALKILERGRQWNLAPALKSGGAVIFPHVSVEVCGHHLAAGIHAAVDSGAPIVLAIGVLHALTDDLQDARVRVAAGGDVLSEPTQGIQGRGLPGREDWQCEFSMIHFEYLWGVEARRRTALGQAVPELVVRYPYLAGGRPHLLPGMAELQRLMAAGAVLLGTADPFHHGLAYGDIAETAKAPNEGGLELCHATVQAGFDMLGTGDYWGFNQHCVAAKSDGRDMGQTIRYLAQKPLTAEIHDIVWEDMSGPYQKPWPSWVSGALITLTPRGAVATDLH